MNSAKRSSFRVENRKGKFSKKIGDFAAEAIQSAIIIGYPIVGILASIADAETSAPAIAFRALVLFASAVAFIGAVTGRASGRISLLLSAFVALYASRLLYDWLFADIDTADTSLMFFAAVTVIPVAAVNLYARRITDDMRFARTIVALGALFLALCVYVEYADLVFNPWADQNVESSRFQVARLNPISVGVAAGSVMLAATYLLVELRHTLKYRLYLLTIATFSLYILLISNSRGPLVGTGLAITWLVIGRSSRFAYFLPISFLILAVVYSNPEVVENITVRFSGDYSTDGSIRDRIIVQRAAIESFIDYPVLGQHFLDPRFGAGFHPHNILFETGMALGLVGLSILFVLLLRVAVNVIWIFGKRHPFYTMLLVQSGLLSLTSGTLWSSDALFFLVGTVLAVSPPFRLFKTSGAQRKREPVVSRPVAQPSAYREGE